MTPLGPNSFFNFLIFNAFQFRNIFEWKIRTLIFNCHSRKSHVCILIGHPHKAQQLEAMNSKYRRIYQSTRSKLSTLFFLKDETKDHSCNMFISIITHITYWNAANYSGDEPKAMDLLHTLEVEESLKKKASCTFTCPFTQPLGRKCPWEISRNQHIL